MPNLPSHLRAVAAALALGLVAVGCSDREATLAPERDGQEIGESPRERLLTGTRPEGVATNRVLDAVSIPDSLERVAALAGLLADLDQEALPEVLAAFEVARPILGDSEWMLLADWWTRFDDRAAYAWVLSNRDHKTPGVLRYVIAGMARTSPERALLALATLRAPEHRQAAFKEIIKAWYPVDPAAVIDHLVALVPGPDRQRAISTLVAIKTRREGTASTRTWAEGLSEELPHRFKLQVFRRVATELALVEPAAGRAFVEEHSAEGSGLYRRFAVATGMDPEETLTWLRGLPPGRERDEAVEEAYRRWIRNDAETARSWMADAPKEPWREPALEVYALAMASDAPREALEIAGGLGDPTRRKYAEIKIAAAWYARDPIAAGAWIETSELPADVLTKIRDRIEKRELQRQKEAARAEARELRKRQRAAREP